MINNKKGIVFIVTAPSGTGKSTLCNLVLEKESNLEFSVSYTSRSPRPAEKEGKDYFFISKKEFRNKIDSNNFLEWAIYVDNYYGTDKLKTREVIESGRDILLDIDIQGADSIKEALPEAIRIFILPPSKEVLKQRLKDRGTNTPGDLQMRLTTAKTEVEKGAEFEYVIINDDLEKALMDLRAIIRAERLKTANNKIDYNRVLRSFE